jgi:cyclin-dependent kinase 8/11
MVSIADFKRRQDAQRPTLSSIYTILGFISSGTYGKVYKAKKRQSQFSDEEYAIKKFRLDKEGESALQSGLSQSAIREIALCRELAHENVIELEEILIVPEERSIAMVFKYAEHDFLQILHYHIHIKTAIPEQTVKSFIFQVLNGLSYLHKNWVLHRDLKPANILVTRKGVVKIGDLGLARIYHSPLQTLYHGDKVVVTIWYRAPELLLGTRHYTKAIDIWATGCILAELLLLKPIFKGEEAKSEKGSIPFQLDQFSKIVSILGFPTKDIWPSLEYMPDYSKLREMNQSSTNNLGLVFNSKVYKSESCFNLLASMLEYDPEKRYDAEKCLYHKYFTEDPFPTNPFIYNDRRLFDYPIRKVL